MLISVIIYMVVTNFFLKLWSVFCTLVCNVVSYITPGWSNTSAYVLLAAVCCWLLSSFCLHVYYYCTSFLQSKDAFFFNNKLYSKVFNKYDYVIYLWACSPHNECLKRLCRDVSCFFRVVMYDGFHHCNSLQFTAMMLKQYQSNLCDNDWQWLMPVFTYKLKIWAHKK